MSEHIHIEKWPVGTHKRPFEFRKIVRTEDVEPEDIGRGIKRYTLLSGERILMALHEMPPTPWRSIKEIPPDVCRFPGCRVCADGKAGKCRIEAAGRMRERHHHEQIHYVLSGPHAGTASWLAPMEPHGGTRLRKETEISLAFFSPPPVFRLQKTYHKLPPYGWKPKPKI